MQKQKERELLETQYLDRIDTAVKRSKLAEGKISKKVEDLKKREANLLVLDQQIKVRLEETAAMIVQNEEELLERKRENQEKKGGLDVRDLVGRFRSKGDIYEYLAQHRKLLCL